MQIEELKEFILKNKASNDFLRSQLMPNDIQKYHEGKNVVYVLILAEIQRMQNAAQ